MDENKVARILREYLPVVEAQCQRPETYAVKIMCERLVGAGIRLEVAKGMIAFVLGTHIERSRNEGRPFDFEAYLAELASLTHPNWND